MRKTDTEERLIILLQFTAYDLQLPIMRKTLKFEGDNIIYSDESGFNVNDVLDY